MNHARFLTLAGAIFSLATTAFAQDIVETRADDITVLKARVTSEHIGFKSNSSSFTHNVDPSKCNMLSQEKIDENRRLATLDCTDQIERLVGTPLMHDVVVRTSLYKVFLYDVCRYEGPDKSYPQHCFSEFADSQNLNCYVTRVFTVLRADKVNPDFAAIGFYAKQGIRTVSRQVLAHKQSVTLKDGAYAHVHEFASLNKCWAGSMSSSMNWETKFRPFAAYSWSGSPTLVRHWDAVESDYVLSGRVESFDRSAELLR